MRKITFVLTLLVFVSVLHSFKQKEDLKYVPFFQEDNDKQKSIERGKELYEEFCLQCHFQNGEGTDEIPPLANSDWLKNRRMESIKAVKYGLKGEIIVNGKKYTSAMPKQRMGADELADIMNYVMNSWGNVQEKLVTVEEVKSIKK